MYDMGVISNQLGLGILLQWKNMVSRGVQGAERDLKKLEGQSKKTQEQFERDVERMRASMEGLQRQMRTGFKMMVAGAAILSPFAFAVRDASTYEQSLSNVESLLIGTGDSTDVAKMKIAALARTILAIAPSTRVQLMQLADSSYDLVSANLTVEEAMGVLKPTADLAVAGMGSMEEATDSMTSALNTFGQRWGDAMSPVEKGAKIANVYASTIAALKTTLPNLSAAMKYAAADAVVLGTSLAETTATIGLLQTKGIFGAKAGTMLMAAFRGLSQMTLRSTEALGPLAGLEVTDAAGNLKPLADILADIEKRLDGLGAYEKGTALLNAFGDEASRAWKILLNQSGALRTLVEQIDAGTAAQGMLYARQSALDSQWQMLKNSLKSLSITIGTIFLPLVKLLVMIAKTVVFWFRRMNDNYPVLTRIISVLTVLIGVLVFLAGVYKVVTAAIGMFRLTMALSTLMNTAATMSFTALAASVWAALWPVLLVVAALGGLLYLLGKIAGFDMASVLRGIFVPEIGGPSIPEFSGAVPPTLTGTAPVQAEPTEGSSASQSMYDYSTNRQQNIFNVDGTKSPKETAEEIRRINNRNAFKSNEGEG